MNALLETNLSTLIDVVVTLSDGINTKQMHWNIMSRNHVLNTYRYMHFLFNFKDI